jgi:WD40 repeat protein
VPDDRSPFQGLGFYTEADAKWFFGRESERKIILAHVRTTRLTVFYAESGVGKSSLLRAGVAARLRELTVQSTGSRRSPRFVPVVFSAWRDDPVADLISEIERQARALLNGTHEDDMPSLAGAGLAAAIRAAASALDATLVIILDQFEEHFSYRLGGRDPGHLANELAQCINAVDVPGNFLIAVREDAYGRLGDLFGGRVNNVYSNYLHLEYLSRDAARDAIEKPVAIYNAEHDEDEAIQLEDDLPDTVLDQVRRGNLELGERRSDRNGGGDGSGRNADEIETPFLQLVMARLWECERAHGSRVLRHTTLDGELGGAETIVRNHVSRALAGLAGQQLETATDIFRALVTPSGVKVAHTADDLARMTGHPPDVVSSVLRQLYEERILRAVDPAPGTTEGRYEIFHDRLAAPILDWRAQQESARLERDKESAELEAKTQRTQARRFKRQARTTLVLAISLLILLIAVGVLLLYARDKSASASKERAEATYFGLTSRAESQLTSRPDVSLMLYLAAYRESPQPVAERNLIATLEYIERSGSIGVLHGHTDAVESIAFSPTQPILASASGDRTVRLWSVSSRAREPLGRPLRASGPLYSVAFAPNGRLLASGSFNDIILWSIRRHAEQASIGDDGGAITSVAFSRDGTMLAAGNANGTVLLWNVVTHTRKLLAVPGSEPVRGIAFSSRGNVLATTSKIGVLLWNVATGARLGPPLSAQTGVASQTGALYCLAFSPDGETLADAGANGVIDLWDLATGSQSPTVLPGQSTVNSIAFSPNGQVLAAGGNGPTVLWDVASQRQIGEPLVRQRGVVNSVAFSPSGTMFASAGADRTISLWDYPVVRPFGIPLVSRTAKIDTAAISPNGLEIASGGDDGQIFISNRRTGRPDRVIRVTGTNVGRVHDLAFNPAGDILASAYQDGTIRLWAPVTGTPVGAPLRGHTGPVFSIAFDHTGTRLVSGGLDGTVRLWNVRTQAELGRPMRGDFGAVYAVAFSPDGRVIASGGDSRSIRLWNARTEMPVDPPLIAQDDAIFSLAFSPDGHVLASGDAGDTIRLWDIGAHDYALVHILTGNSNYVRSVAFSPDGATLASGSSDATVRLWDVKTGTELGPPGVGDSASVESVAFSSKGQFLASGSADGTVRLWPTINLPASFADLRGQVCSFLGAGLSTAEWSQYAPNIPYQQTCPRTTPS